MSEDGDTYVIQAGPEFKVLGQELARRDDAGDAGGVARQPDHPDGVEALPSRQETASLMRAVRLSAPHPRRVRRRRASRGSASWRASCAFTRTLLVADRGIVATGQVERAPRRSLTRRHRLVRFSRLRRQSRFAHGRGRARASRHRARIDSIVALGGGSSLDCAKGINFVLTNGGTMRDYRGFGKAAQPMLPSIGVPTTAGTGSEAQSLRAHLRRRDAREDGVRRSESGVPRRDSRSGADRDAAARGDRRSPATTRSRTPSSRS